jgi:hypothetical protein
MKTFRALLRINLYLISLIAITTALTMTTRAQTPKTQGQTTPPPTPVSPPAANSADVATMDSVLAALYEVISGPAGTRNWDRFRSLFIPGARLIPTTPRPTGEVGSRVLTVDEYVQRAGAFFEKEGFFEREAARRVETFGNIAHVFSTYESRHARDDAKPFQRGINSIQLMNDGKRWWVVTIFWQGEDEKHPLPGKYLESKN